MKKILLLICISMLSTIGFSQIMVGGNVGLYNSTAQGSEGVWGGDLTLRYGLSESFKVGLNAGIYSTSEEVLGTRFSSGVTPVTGLLEYWFLEDALRPYAGVNLGLYSFFAKAGNTRTSSGYFGFAPTIGANYFFLENLAANVNLKLHTILTDNETTTAFGLGFGVIFAF